LSLFSGHDMGSDVRKQKLLTTFHVLGSEDGTFLSVFVELVLSIRIARMIESRGLSVESSIALLSGERVASHNS
jgi:hypothetical protein